MREAGGQLGLPGVFGGGLDYLQQRGELVPSPGHVGVSDTEGLIPEGLSLQPCRHFAEAHPQGGEEPPQRGKVGPCLLGS
ncbi:MAG TPA: hypothetical protein VLF66_10230 [Thermoanaerobaculia bacterium]|nr:hypothetical protein [Thermoanaerobaculia bacterium]